MIKNSERGIAKFILVVAVCMLGLVAVALILSGANKSNIALPGTPATQGGTNPLLSFLNTNNSGSYNSNYNSDVNTNNSLSVSLGNATYQNQPYREYVTIRNSGSKSVDITGMVLKNSIGSRPLQTSENSAYYPTEQTAVIGKGAKLLAASGVQTMGDIILMPGDTAYIITGNPAPAIAPINASFKENKCTGYLSKKYSFEPRLNNSCPVVLTETNKSLITKQCYDYVQNLYRCENPEDTNLNRLKQETTVCQNFVKSQMNYPACVLIHYKDTDFYGHNWYVFLGKGKEMWTQDDTITLVDTKGNVVAKSSW